ncbi:MAG: hypothetical protein KF752_08885 [Pirellulaceae bacterium]|nr:hypothetical protein [Pirellulaceae bacterium]
MEALKLFNQGALAAAITSAQEVVRNHPTQHRARETLADLLCIEQQLDRADKHLESIVLQQPQSSVNALLSRQLIRAETSRREVWSQGRMPEFVGEPGDCCRQTLAALVAFRNNEPARAVEILQAVEDSIPTLIGTCNGQEYEGFRDLDDLCLGIVEVLTSTGKYFWIPTSRITSMQFSPPTGPRDLLWRECHMQVVDGPDGVVYVPAIYIHTTTEDPQALLGRTTNWLEEAGRPTTGMGQRMFMIGDQDLGIMEINELQFRR